MVNTRPFSTVPRAYKHMYIVREPPFVPTDICYLGQPIVPYEAHTSLTPTNNVRDHHRPRFAQLRADPTLP